MKKKRIPWNKGKTGVYSKEYRDKISLTLKSKGIKPPPRTGAEPWNKGLKGFLGREDSPHWKGDNIGYDALHKRVFVLKGSPLHCELCGLEGYKHKGRWVIEWANISGEYKDENDFIGMCIWCHRNFDKIRRKNSKIKDENKSGE